MVEKIRGCCTNSEWSWERKILLRILGKNIVTIFLLRAVNIDLETLDSWVCYYKETKGQILALNHLVVSNFVLDQLQICKKNRSRSTHLHYCMFPGNSFNTVCFYSKIVAWNTLLGQVQNLTTFITTQYAFFLDAFLPPPCESCCTVEVFFLPKTFTNNKMKF